MCVYKVSHRNILQQEICKALMWENFLILEEIYYSIQYSTYNRKVKEHIVIAYDLVQYY